MALLDRRLKQRIVGAVVLLGLAAWLLPMLLDREDERRLVRVEAPPMPPMPPVAQPGMPPPITVPEPQAMVPVEPVVEAPPVVEPRRATAAPPSAPVAAPPQPPRRLDADGVPVSWTVQVVSLSSRVRAEELQRKLRDQGFDAYIRSADGRHRVFVGPLLERAAAERVREQIARQHRLSPIVVRFQPERR